MAIIQQLVTLTLTFEIEGIEDIDEAMKIIASRVTPRKHDDIVYVGLVDGFATTIIENNEYIIHLPIDFEEDGYDYTSYFS